MRSNLVKKLKSLAVITTGGALTFTGIGIYKNNESFYEELLMPCVHAILNPEQAHRFAVLTAKWGLIPHSQFQERGNVLETSLWGLKFKNPVGIAAGFDKDGEAASGLFKTGIGFVEVGSVTPQPQDGNPKPRVFRLHEDKAIINRYGFNSRGHEYTRKQLEYFDKEKGILGVNLGKNKLSESAEDDYVEGVKQFSSIADYLVINVSSPNTPGLRSLQMAGSLESLLDKIIEARNNNVWNKLIEITIDGANDNSRRNKPPILLKISPDLSYKERQDVAKVIQRKEKQIDGLIVCNTTTSRPESLMSNQQQEIGGLSGKPLNSLSTQAISDMYQLTKGVIPIIGVGGISSGKDAYEKIRAGASLIQLYSALIYSGPPLIEKIKKDLEQLIIDDGFKNVSEAVGADHRR